MFPMPASLEPVDHPRKHPAVQSGPQDRQLLLGDLQRGQIRGLGGETEVGNPPGRGGHAQKYRKEGGDAGRVDSFFLLFNTFPIF